MQVQISKYFTKYVCLLYIERATDDIFYAFGKFVSNLDLYFIDVGVKITYSIGGNTPLIASGCNV